MFRAEELLRRIADNSGLLVLIVCYPIYRSGVPLGHLLLVDLDGLLSADVLFRHAHHIHRCACIHGPVQVIPAPISRLVDIGALAVDGLSHKVRITLVDLTHYHLVMEYRLPLDCWQHESHEE